MRKRNKEIKVRFTEKELEELDAKVARTYLSRENYIRAVLAGYEIMEAPNVDARELMIVFAGLVTLLSNGFSGDDIGFFLFFLAFFLLGLFLVKKNKKDKAVRKAEAGSYSTYTPYNGQKIGWGVVIIALLFFFPVGFYLLYKKMSQYSNPSEVQRNSKTLKIWATVLICLGCIYPVMSIAGALEASAAIMCFAALFPFGLLLNKRSKSLAMMYTALPTPHESQANAANTLSQNIEHKQDVMLSTSSPIGSVYTEYQ